MTIRVYNFVFEVPGHGFICGDAEGIAKKSPYPGEESLYAVELKSIDAYICKTIDADEGMPFDQNLFHVEHPEAWAVLEQYLIDRLAMETLPEAV